MWQQNKEQAVQLGKLSHSETDLMETNKRLRETVDRAREELRTSQAQAEKSRQEVERCRRWSLVLRRHSKENRTGLEAPLSSHQAAGGPTGEVVRGQARAAGERDRAAAEILPGQREAAEGSSGSEEGQWRCWFQQFN